MREIHQLGLQAPNDAIIVICTWQSQIGGRIFLVLKSRSASSGPLNVKGTCLSLEALPHWCTREKGHVPASAGDQENLSWVSRAAPEAENTASPY